MHEAFEASLSQRDLLTASLRPNNGITYVNTKENLTRSQESEYFTSSMRSTTSAKSNASVPYNFKKEPVIAHEPYDLLMPHGSLSSLSTLMTSNEVTNFIIFMERNKKNYKTLFLWIQGYYSKLGSSAEYSLVLEKVR